MKKHSSKIVAVLLAVVLLAAAADAKLAQPERTGQSDSFIGYHMVYEKTNHAVIDMSDPDWESQVKDIPAQDRSAWVEYGSHSLAVDGFGTIDLPNVILIGQRQEDGSYLFPTLEGINCFFAVYTDENGERHLDGYGNGGECYVSVHERDQETEYKLEAEVIYGPPLDDSHWNTEDFDYFWTAYQVFQMEDGTVYLDGSGNSYGGVGGFGINTRTEETLTRNGEKTTTIRDISVKINSVPRLEQVEIRQYDENDQLLRTDCVTQQQAMEREGAELTLPLEPAAAYAVVAETDVEGRTTRKLENVEESGTRSILVKSWFLKENGLGYPQSISLVGDLAEAL